MDALTNEEIVDWLEDHGTWVRADGGGSVWEFATIEEAQAAVAHIGPRARPWNWTVNDLHRSLEIMAQAGKRPTICVTARPVKIGG